MEEINLQTNKLPALPWYALKTEERSFLVFCSEDCFDMYVNQVVCDEYSYALIAEPPGVECVSCHWCGHAIYRSEDQCFLHGNRCPAVNWIETHQGGVCVTILSRFFNGKQVPDELIEDCEVLAGGFGPDVDGAYIAQSAYNAWKLFG